MYYMFFSQDVQNDRLVIAKQTAAAMRAKADGKPLDFVFMAANQTSHALPTLYPPTHGSDRYYAHASTAEIRCRHTRAGCCT